jgi:hypothetical protein
MVCISVLLIGWIGIVWFQDKRTIAKIESHGLDVEKEVEDLGMTDMSPSTKDKHIITTT